MCQVREILRVLLLDVSSCWRHLIVGTSFALNNCCTPLHESERMERTRHEPETRWNVSGLTPHELMFGRGIAVFPDDLFPGSVKLMVTRENATNLETLWDRTKQIVSKVLDQLAMRDSDFKIMLNNSIGMHLSEVVDESSDVASMDELDVESGDSDDLCSNHCSAASTNDGQNRSRKLGPWVVVDDCCTGDRDIETDAEFSPWTPGVDDMKTDYGNGTSTVEDDLRKVFDIVRNRNIRALRTSLNT